jgi:hypothetical protein
VSARNLMTACALVGSATVFVGCTNSTKAQEAPVAAVRDGSVSVSGLKSSKLDGVSLYAEWKTDYSIQSRLQTAGNPETAPRLMTAQCSGTYPDMRVEVQGPDGVDLVAESDTTIMNLQLPGLGPIEITPPPVSYEWNPNGIDMYIDMGTGSDDTGAERLPQETGIVQGGILIRMKVTCP